MQDNDLAVLESFVLDNPVLERLEAILDDFNPFVALRWTRQETRHSSFLQWLLDPSETHGLGAYFLRQFLKYIASRSPLRKSDIPSIVDLDSWPYSATLVQQEWNNIDLLIRDDSLGLVVVLENKVDSTEHSSQLQKYRSLIEQQFPQHKKLFAYLTINGSIPTDESYVSLTYAEIVKLIEETISRRNHQLSPAVVAFMQFYVEMIRRHIVEDSEIQKLCDQIYKAHHRALEVLFEHRPDKALMIKEFLENLITKIPSLEPDYSVKSYIRFIPKSLDFFPRHGQDWTPSKRLVLFEFDQASMLKLKIVLGPGRQTSRDRIQQFIAKHPAVFNRASTKCYPQWWSFHIEEWISRKQYEGNDLEELKQQIQARFGEFIEKQLPNFTKVLEELRESTRDQQEA